MNLQLTYPETGMYLAPEPEIVKIYCKPCRTRQSINCSSFLTKQTKKIVFLKISLTLGLIP